MIFRNMLDFITYLEHHGYLIPVDKAAMVLRMLPSIKTEEDAVGIMRTNFCSDKMQYIKFKEEFDSFIKEQTELLSIKEKEKLLTGIEQEYENTIAEKKNELKEIEKNIHTRKKEIFESQERKIEKKDKDFLINNKEFIEETDFTEESNNFLDILIKTSEESMPLPYMPKEAEKLAEEVVEKCEKAVSEGNLEEFKKLKRIRETAQNIILLDMKQEKEMKKRIKKETKELEERKRALNDSIDIEDSGFFEEKEELSSNSADKHKIVIKECSVTHRDEFIKGIGNSVQITDESIIGILGEKFENIDDSALSEIYKFLQHNAIKFKTKIHKSLNKAAVSEIDMKNTIEQACRTGGLPLKIMHKAPKANRAKLIICLDMSGSCCEASKMMLSFIYMLQEMFPAGCKAFAFVNKLHDISKIMKEDDILSALNKVMETVPTRGIYSNYYRPLKELWTYYGQDITSDTFVIFIGDARNNDNESGSDYIKNIARKAKKTIWFNTEPYYTWGMKDSMAHEYRQYFDMYEVITPLALIEAMEKL